MRGFHFKLLFKDKLIDFLTKYDFKEEHHEDEFSKEEISMLNNLKYYGAIYSYPYKGREIYQGTRIYLQIIDFLDHERK